MSTYIGQTPSSNGTVVSQAIIQFYQNFYATSDDPSEAAHATYVQAFSEDATLVMGSKSATGQAALLELRKGLWSGPVKSRRHTLEKIFPWDDEGKELMLYGHVLYELKNGKEVTVDWAARAVLNGPTEGKQGSGEDVKMTFYQVYLDSAPVANAVKD